MLTVVVRELRLVLSLHHDEDAASATHVLQRSSQSP